MALLTPTNDIYIPGWCSWVPFSELTDSCKLPTPDQIYASDMANLGPSASSQTVQAAQQAWANTMAQQNAQYPDLANDYAYGVSHPITGSLFGTTVGSTVTNTVDSISTAINKLADDGYLVPIFLGAAVLFTVTFILPSGRRR